MHPPSAAGFNSHIAASGPLADTPDISGPLALIERAGSERVFYRVVTGGGRSVIVMRYGPARRENLRFVPAARLLAGLAIPVPEIFAWDPERHLVWMEDLGDSSLWTARNEPWPYRAAIYQQVLRHAAVLHKHGLGRVCECRLPPEREFDETLYAWEQGYFFDNCLGRHFGLEPAETEGLRALPALREVARHLAATPRALVHRDLQSQNILLRGGGEAVFIDFQGMRPGHPYYDVASLLLDPYTDLTEQERGELFAFYLEAFGSKGAPPEREFVFCAIQRLMQALGAYGFLGHVKGKTEFLAHIPAALERLRQSARRVPGLEPLAECIEKLS